MEHRCKVHITQEHEFIHQCNLIILWISPANPGENSLMHNQVPEQSHEIHESGEQT